MIVISRPKINVFLPNLFSTVVCSPRKEFEASTNLNRKEKRNYRISIYILNLMSTFCTLPLILLTFNCLALKAAVMKPV